MPHQLRRIIAINILNPITGSPSGRISELDPRGGVLTVGANGVGKTSFLRLIPLFYGATPSQVLKGTGRTSMIKHTLPDPSSAVAYEYERESDAHLRTAVLQPKPVVAPPKEVRRIQRVVDEPQVIEKTQAAIALERLIAAAQQATERFSVVRWRDADPQAQTIQAHVWLVFAVMALRSRKCSVEVVASPARVGERFRHQFHDAMVVPKGVAAP